MSKAAKSIFVFGIYLAVLGLGLLIIPNTVLTLLGYSTTSESWIRVVGLLALVLAFFYLQAARSDVEFFFRWTVVTRPAAFVIFTLMVILKLAEPPLVLTGVIDLLGALWTGWALRSSPA